MLTFDPSERITVPEALEHPWLAAYHDVTDEPACPAKFEKWRQIEELETLEDFREALWTEIEEYRREVRGIKLDVSGLSLRGMSNNSRQRGGVEIPETAAKANIETRNQSEATPKVPENKKDQDPTDTLTAPTPAPSHLRPIPTSPTDPVVTYARRSTIMGPSRQGSTYNSPMVAYQHLPTFAEGPLIGEPGSLPTGGITFPTQGYVLPARSRTGSTTGAGEVTRKLLRTLSTVSIHESVEGLEGGLAGIAPIGKYIVQRQTTEADAPPSEMPREFGIDETSEGEEEDEHLEIAKEKKGNRFQIH
jgi:hypothetical protein